MTHKFFVIAVLLCGLGELALAQPSTCKNHDRLSEYSWNPPDSAVTVRLQKFYDLSDKLKALVDKKQYDTVPMIAEEYLSLAKVYRCNFDYGNAIHDANAAIGLARLAVSDTNGAKYYLLAAAVSPGSPQLNTFGPDLSLANELLKRGADKEVAQYLRGIQKFWESGEPRISRWLSEIERGRHPTLDRFDFGP